MAVKIGNIVSSTKVNVSEEFNVVKSINDIIPKLPTLVIGFDWVNKHYPDFDITNKELDTNLYWTFKKTEKRDKHDEDILWFMNKTYKDLVSKIPYIFIDPIQYQKKKLIKILKKINSVINVTSYQHGQMIYMYGDGVIFGVDLKLLNYMGVNCEKIKTKIKNHSKVFLEDDNILIEYKKHVEGLDKQTRYIPYLYAISNG